MKVNDRSTSTHTRGQLFGFFQRHRNASQANGSNIESSVESWISTGQAVEQTAAFELHVGSVKDGWEKIPCRWAAEMKENDRSLQVS